MDCGRTTSRACTNSAASVQATFAPGGAWSKPLADSLVDGEGEGHNGAALAGRFPLHAGKPCSACESKAGYSRISDAEINVIMKNAVNHVYKLLRLKADDPEGYERQIAYGERCTM